MSCSLQLFVPCVPAITNGPIVQHSLVVAQDEVRDVLGDLLDASVVLHGPPQWGKTVLVEACVNFCQEKLRAGE